MIPMVLICSFSFFFFSCCQVWLLFVYGGWFSPDGVVACLEYDSSVVYVGYEYGFLGTWVTNVWMGWMGRSISTAFVGWCGGFMMKFMQCFVLFCFVNIHSCSVVLCSPGNVIFLVRWTRMIALVVSHITRSFVASHGVFTFRVMGC